jgi:hypothetical protein
MSVLDRIVRRVRHTPPDHSAARRSEQIIERVDGQWAEVRRHSAFARLVMEENHLAPKIRRALREN